MGLAGRIRHMSQTILYQAVERSKAYRFIKYAVGASHVPYRSLLADLLRTQTLRSLSRPYLERAHRSALLDSRNLFVGASDPQKACAAFDALYAAGTTEEILAELNAQHGAPTSIDAVPDESPDAARAFLHESEALLAPLTTGTSNPGSTLSTIASRTLDFCARVTPCWTAPQVSLMDLVPAIYHQQCQYFFEKCDSIPPAMRIAKLIATSARPAPGIFFGSTVGRQLVEHLSLPLNKIRKECPSLAPLSDSTLREAVAIALEAATYAQSHGMDLWESRSANLPFLR